MGRQGVESRAGRAAVADGARQICGQHELQTQGRLGCQASEITRKQRARQNEVGLGKRFQRKFAVHLQHVCFCLYPSACDLSSLFCLLFSCPFIVISAFSLFIFLPWCFLSLFFFFLPCFGSSLPLSDLCFTLRSAIPFCSVMAAPSLNLCIRRKVTLCLHSSAQFITERPRSDTGCRYLLSTTGPWTCWPAHIIVLLYHSCKWENKCISNVMWWIILFEVKSEVNDLAHSAWGLAVLFLLWLLRRHKGHS